MKVRAWIGERAVSGGTLHLRSDDPHELVLEVLDGKDEPVEVAAVTDAPHCALAPLGKKEVPLTGHLAADKKSITFPWGDARFGTLTCSHGKQTLLTVNVASHVLGCVCAALVILVIAAPLLVVSTLEAFVKLDPELQRWGLALKNLGEILGVGTSLFIGVKSVSSVVQLTSLSPLITPVFTTAGKFGIGFSVLFVLAALPVRCGTLYENAAHCEVQLDGATWKAGEVWMLAGAERAAPPLCAGERADCFRPPPKGSSRQPLVSVVAGRSVGCERWWKGSVLPDTTDPAEVKDGCRTAVFKAADTELELVRAEGAGSSGSPARFAVDKDGLVEQATNAESRPPQATKDDPPTLEVKAVASADPFPLRLEVGPGRAIGKGIRLRQVNALVTVGRTLVVPAPEGARFEVTVRDRDSGQERGRLRCSSNARSLVFWSVRDDSIQGASAIVDRTQVSSWEPRANGLDTLLAICVPRQKTASLELKLVPQWQPDEAWSLPIPGAAEAVALRFADGRVLGTVSRKLDGKDWILRTHYLTAAGVTNATRADLLSTPRVQRLAEGGSDVVGTWERAIQGAGVFEGWFWLTDGKGKCMASRGYGPETLTSCETHAKFPFRTCTFDPDGTLVPRCDSPRPPAPNPDQWSFVIKSKARGCDRVLMCRR